MGLKRFVAIMLAVWVLFSNKQGASAPSFGVKNELSKDALQG